MAYSFKNGPLDQLIGQLIGSSKEARAWENIRRNIPLTLIKHNGAGHELKFQPNGVFSIKDGTPLRVYLYLENYNVAQYHYPRKHYFHCQTVKTYTNFLSTNRETVDIFCTSTQKKYPNLNLPVCEHCRIIFNNQTTRTLLGESFNDFILQMACNGNELMPKDLHGYPINFSEISTAFRTLKSYTCKKCGLKITDKTHQHYMHTHHINYQKDNNCLENLECLCIRCHSNVDSIHQRNFRQSQPLFRELQKFEELYPVNPLNC